MTARPQGDVRPSDATESTGSGARGLDPQLRRVTLLYRRVDHADAASVRREAARRQRVARVAGLWQAEDPAVTVRDVRVPGDDAAGIGLRVYRPSSATGTRPAVLFLHGGAFISGDLDFEHPRCLEMCRETGFIVVAVEYRLAPEFPYPAALRDCLAALDWLRAEAGQLGVDPARVAVGGSSAGGALAAALCLHQRDNAMPLPAAQLLIYPVIDDRLDSPSMRAFTDTPIWDQPNCVHMWDHYLGPAARRGTVPPYAAPGRATDLAGLPPAYLMTAELDPMRDEGDTYAGRLAAAGVSTRHRRYPGTFHGFDTLASAEISRQARHEHYAFLRDALG